jgi:hypothetical protein
MVNVQLFRVVYRGGDTKLAPIRHMPRRCSMVLSKKTYRSRSKAWRVKKVHDYANVVVTDIQKTE